MSEMYMSGKECQEKSGLKLSWSGKCHDRKMMSGNVLLPFQQRPTFEIESMLREIKVLRGTVGHFAGHFRLAELTFMRSDRILFTRAVVSVLPRGTQEGLLRSFLCLVRSIIARISTVS